MRARSETFYLQPLIALVLIVGALYLAKPFIIPLVFALLLAFILNPIVIFVQRPGFKRVYAVVATVTLTFALLGILGWVVGIQFHALATELPAHRKEIETKIAALREGGGTFAELFKMFREIDKGAPPPVEAPVAAAKERDVIITRPEDPSSFERLIQAAAPVLEPLANAGLVIVLVIFMLITREDLRNRFIGILGHGRLTGTTSVIVDSAQRLSRYLLTQVIINVSFGALFAFGLFLLGVDYAILWGFLTAALRFVPYVGAAISALLPLILSFATAPSWAQPTSILVYFALLELVTSNVIEPLTFGHSTGVSPVALLVAAAFWTWIWGPIGLVLSTPLTVCLVVLGQHVPRLGFFSLLLGDQPALKPHVAYYQRLLARDPREAEEIVTEHVKRGGLENVYDDVLLPALAMARRDREDAGLSAVDEGFIFQTTEDILGRLTPAPDEPVGNQGVISTVLIFGCPAHHAAEELLLQMLNLLMRPDRFRVEVISTKTLAIELETRVERQRPGLLFIGVLPPGGLAQTRYLCKRLRARFADLPIVVGYWGPSHNFDKILRQLRAAGADYLTTSLLQARTQIEALLEAPAPAHEEMGSAVKSHV